VTPRTPDLFGDPKKPRKAKPKLLTGTPVPPDFCWICFDPCSLAEPKNPKTPTPKMGWAIFVGTALRVCGSIQHDRSVGRWRIVLRGKAGMAVWDEQPSEWGAIRAVLRDGRLADRPRLQAVFMERAIGMNPRVVSDQADARGYIRGLAHEAGIDHVLEIPTPATWKRATGQHFDSPYPAKSKDAKLHSVALVREHFGLPLADTDDDVADAICQGVAIPYLGLMPEFANAAVALADKVF